MINEVMTIKEAEKIWGLNDCLKNCIRRGHFKIDTDVRKSGGTWLITRDAMVNRYGLPKEG